ncbi:MAG: ABC transporter permease [Tannerellaceae bacterium]|nr:ABC transporter permease [Tannerellaceae bacterium]
MFKRLYKTIWQQRRANGWIFAELLIVAGVLWVLTDIFLVDYRTYTAPLGYDITNTYRFKLATLPPKSPEYIVPEEVFTSQTEDLLKLMQQIRLEPDVEEVCATYYSCPYSFGNSWHGIRPVDGDTTLSTERAFQVRRVTPEYFTVFRVKDKNGRQIVPQNETGHVGIVISHEMEEAFYKNGSGKGRRVILSNNDREIPVMDVCRNVRPSDYEKSDPCFYEIMESDNLIKNVDQFGAASAELCVRMKQEKSPVEMNLFLERMGERLKVNNLYVNGYISLKAQRKDYLRYPENEIKMKVALIVASYRRGFRFPENEIKMKVALIVFVLVNVFFGIIGTFWIRTQKRRGEIGLQITMGSTRWGVFRYMNLEGLVLLLFTLPFVVLFAATLIYLDIPDMYRLPMTPWRLLVTFGITYLILAAMICLGISFPARKAMEVSPAEALHYE